MLHNHQIQVWEIKNKYYFEKAPFKTQLLLSDYVDKSQRKWSKESIIKRGKDILDFAIKYWGTDEESKQYDSRQNEDIEELIEENQDEIETKDIG